MDHVHHIEHRTHQGHTSELEIKIPVGVYLCVCVCDCVYTCKEYRVSLTLLKTSELSRESNVALNNLVNKT